MPFARLPFLIFLFPGEKKKQKQPKQKTSQSEHLHFLAAAWLPTRVTTAAPSNPDSYPYRRPRLPSLTLCEDNLSKSLLSSSSAWITHPLFIKYG